MTARDLGTVLVVDDDKCVRQAARLLLEVFGYRVLAAEDGREAVAIFGDRRDEIDAVVLDLRMPGMDGEETFLELAAIDPSVRVVICSGSLEPALVRRLSAKGVVAFVTKPFEASAFVDVVREALRPVPV